MQNETAPEHQLRTGALSGRIAAGMLALLAAGYAFYATQIEYSFASDPIGPKGFPLLLAALLALFALVYAARPGLIEAWPDTSGRRSILAFMIACVVAMLAMPHLGFMPVMAALMSFVSWLFGATLGAAIVSGVIQAIVWWALFGPLVGHTLPKGQLGI